MNDGIGVAERGREVIIWSKRPHLVGQLAKTPREQRPHLSTRPSHGYGTSSPRHGVQIARSGDG